MFFFLFTAFNTIQLFESTVNEGSGIASLAVLYASFTLCNIASAAIVSALGARRSLCAGALAYIVFILANLRPVRSHSALLSARSQR